MYSFSEMKSSYMAYFQYTDYIAKTSLIKQITTAAHSRVPCPALKKNNKKQFSLCLQATLIELNSLH